MEFGNILQISHKEVVFKHEDDARMILTYHNMGNGICFGGIRLLPHDSIENGLRDSLRLSEAMTYKLALIDAPYGGCKAVVFLPKAGKTEKFLHNIGTLIEEEKGRFISAIDFGFEPNDAKIIREKTKYILAVIDSNFGQSGTTTAHGVIEGIKVSLNKIFGSQEMRTRSFAVQGLGSVGGVLARELIRSGGNVYVSDVSPARRKEFENIATVVSADEIISLSVDVLAPCGPAYVINKNTIPHLHCKIIAGGANCQLEDEVKDDQLLYEAGILIAPDYAINAGGVIQGIEELTNGSFENVVAKLSVIRKNLEEIYERSGRHGEGTYTTAKKIALNKLAN